jgi:hypothetical protein
MRISAGARVWAGWGQAVVVWLWSLGREKGIDVEDEEMGVDGASAALMGEEKEAQAQVSCE